MIDVTLLGTGGGMPMINRYLSSVVLGYKGRKILLDCGEGTQVAIRKYKTGFKAIDIICISHLHGDHIFGLPGLLSTMGNSERKDPVTIIGPTGIDRVLKGLLLSLNYLPFRVDVLENPERPLAINFENDLLSVEEYDNISKPEMLMDVVNLKHSVQCLGYSFTLNRLAKFIPEKALDLGIPKEMWKVLQRGDEVDLDGKTYLPSMVLGDDREGIKLTFVTDTRPTENIVEFIKGSNLFICEGTYGDDEDINKAKENKHMTFREAGKLAKDGNVRDLLITHFSPSMEVPKLFKDNAKEVFANTTIGYDGYFKTLSFL